MKITRSVVKLEEVEVNLTSTHIMEWPEEALAAARLHVLTDNDALRELIASTSPQAWLANRLERHFEAREKARRQRL